MTVHEMPEGSTRSTHHQHTRMTGAEIRAARESLGLTQLQFAQVLGYAHVTRISEFEHGKGSPSAQTVLLIRLYLSGVRPDYWPKNARTA